MPANAGLTDEPLERTEKAIARNWPVKFVPALLVVPVWFYTVGSQNLWGDVFEYWPMSVAMVLGSFVAGSTPLGGGVVAFPVSVLVLGFTASEGRDISVLVQSVGMNSAAYLLVVTKPHLLDLDLIINFCITGTIGIITGIAIDPPSRIMSLLYTVIVFEFGLIFFYVNVLDPARHTREKIGTPDMRVTGPLGDGMLAKFACNALMLFCGIIGGIVTSSIGSGSDILMFLFGLFGYNIIYPQRKFSEYSLTASSVVVMGVLSLVTSIVRLFNGGGFSDKIIFTWAAMAPVVTFGAPIGSIVIGPKALPFLRIMFYILALVQFACFAGLEIKGSVNEWIFITVISTLLITLLTVHHRFLSGRVAARTEEQALANRKSMYKKNTMETMEDGSSDPEQASEQEETSFPVSLSEP